jgi:hypothetical protein
MFRANRLCRNIIQQQSRSTMVARRLSNAAMMAPARVTSNNRIVASSRLVAVAQQHQHTRQLSSGRQLLAKRNTPKSKKAKKAYAPPHTPKSVAQQPADDDASEQSIARDHADFTKLQEIDPIKLKEVCILFVLYSCRVFFFF